MGPTSGQDLDDIGNLETHITATQCMLLFLSRGYFSSVNVLREVKATVVQEKKVTLVHEVDTNKGGAPIADMKAQCPNELREGVFGAVGAPREIISWLRVHDFQVVSLKSIVSQLLHSMPSFASAPRPPGVYLPRELEQSTFDFKHQVVVYTSQHNPGAREFVRELEELVVSSSGKSTRSIYVECTGLPCDRRHAEARAASHPGLWSEARCFWRDGSTLTSSEIRSSPLVGLATHVGGLGACRRACDPSIRRRDEGATYRQLPAATRLVRTCSCISTARPSRASWK